MLGQSATREPALTRADSLNSGRVSSAGNLLIKEKGSGALLRTVQQAGTLAVPSRVSGQSHRPQPVPGMVRRGVRMPGSPSEQRALPSGSSALVRSSEANTAQRDSFLGQTLAEKPLFLGVLVKPRGKHPL